MLQPNRSCMFGFMDGKQSGGVRRVWLTGWLWTKPTGCYKLLSTGGLCQSIKHSAGQLARQTRRPCWRGCRAPQQPPHARHVLTPKTRWGGMSSTAAKALSFNPPRFSRVSITRIDFLITLSPLNNQATANALVITLQRNKASVLIMPIGQQMHSVFRHLADIFTVFTSTTLFFYSPPVL